MEHDLGSGRKPEIYRAKGYTITVQEVRAGDNELLAAAGDSKWVRLGARNSREHDIEITVNALLRRLQRFPSEMFLLTWQGNKIPRGAKVKGQEIAWTQNGVVASTEGEIIGTYQRLVEFGGRRGKTQQMLVFCPIKRAEQSPENL